MNDTRLHAPATLRNREPILAVLHRILPASGLVLELNSGSGEHAVHFAAALPRIQWQPSDIDPGAQASITARTAEAGLENLLPVCGIDATAPVWTVAQAAAVVSINMIHIALWDACLGLLDGAARILPPGDGVLYLYGPFKRHDRHTAPSNEAFDQSLRGRDARWGIRNLETVIAEAAARGLGLQEIIEMPANNLSVVFRKKG
ncbi:MAG: DUF938 domain-containing protein [Proteobacteria bacterium]|nr:DUF938 domain-containing protein [Pseudomonadota bacterium]